MSKNTIKHTNSGRIYSEGTVKNISNGQLNMLASLLHKSTEDVKVTLSTTPSEKFLALKKLIRAHRDKSISVDIAKYHIGKLLGVES